MKQKIIDNKINNTKKSNSQRNWYLPTIKINEWGIKVGHLLSLAGNGTCTQWIVHVARALRANYDIAG